MVTILPEFCCSVLKDEEHHLNHLIPYRNSVTMCLNGFSGFQATTDEELKVSNVLSVFLFMQCGVMTGKDMVKVNGLSR